LSATESAPPAVSAIRGRLFLPVFAFYALGLIVSLIIVSLTLGLLPTVADSVAWSPPSDAGRLRDRC
jgi:hypothetical protein